MKPGAALQTDLSFTDSLIQQSFLSHSFVAPPRTTVRDSSSINKIDYFIVIKDFLDLEGHQNPINGSEVIAILQKEWIWPIS